MNEPSSGLNISLQILKDVNKCIICQKNKYNKGNAKFASTEKGRESIINCSSCLKDDLLEGIPKRNYEEIEYHVNTCYTRCVRSRERFEKKTEITQIEDLNDEPGPSTSFTENRPKRRRMSDVNFTLPSEKPCITCNQMKSRGDAKILRTSTARRASLFLSTINLNKNEVLTRCILLGRPGDIFATDIMYRKNCLSNYLRKFEHDVKMIIKPPLDSAKNVEITNIFQEFLRTINIKNHAYCLSDCSDSFNEVLIRQGMNGNYLFTNPLGRGMSLGRPIQGII